MATISTDNFHPNTDTMLLCSCGHPDCDRRSVSQSHLDRCQRVRDLFGPLTVTSGGRCPNHPEELGRRNTDHQRGEGMDVYCTGLTRGNIVAAAITAGCNAIGVANNFVHLGYRADLPDGHVTMWTYS